MTAPTTPDPSADRPSGARGEGASSGAEGGAEGLPVDARAAAEAQALIARYTRRSAEAAARYRLLDPAALAEQQGRLRAWARLWAAQGWSDLSMLNVLEVGCGDGGNLLDLLRLGVRPERLRGLELQPERAAAARARLPATLRIELGDALAARVAPASLDAVLQFTVFSSILDDAVQQRLARAMWSWVKPGGGVLWYDFAVNNPRNPDVRGVPVARVRALFPEAQAQVRWLTLAPPLARRVGRWWPGGIAWLHALLPPLRTHRLVWLRKPGPVAS